MKKRLKTLLPDNVKTDVAFQGKHLSSCFNIKDKTKFPHKHDLVNHAGCPEESCNDDYVDETARHISERVIDHSGRNKNSHVLTLKDPFISENCIEIKNTSFTLLCGASS